jgi:hypothetical protein
MTYDIFIVLVSTVAFKSYFSVTNMIVTDKRTRFYEKIFESLVLLND